MQKLFSIILLTLAAAIAATASTLPSWLDIAKDGTFRIEGHTFRLVNFDPSFAYKKFQEKKLEKQADAVLFRGTFPDAAFQAEFQPRSADAFRYRGTLTATGKQIEITGLFLEFRISGAPRILMVDGKPWRFPAKPAKNKVDLFARKCNSATIPLDSGSRLTFTGTTVLKIRDNRVSDQDAFTIRLFFRPSPGLCKESALSLDIARKPLTGTALDLSRAANMGFADEVAGDGKGGWTDQGPHNDLRSFTLRNIPVGGTEFRLIDPAKNGGKTTIVLGKHFPREVSLPVSGRGSYLYVLHATGWTQPEKAGEFEVTYADKSSQKISVVSNRDVGNWWNPDHLPNGVVLWRGDNRTTGIGLYFSQFKLDRDDPVKVTLRGVKSQLWLIPALTLASGSIPLQGNDRPIIIQEGKEWIRLNTTRTIKPGSPLDFSGMLDAPAGKYGRVVVAPDGHFTFEKAPEKRIRFVGVNFCNRAQYLTHKESDELAERLARHGYNAIRIHHHDNFLVKQDAPDSLTIDPEMLDRLEYLFAACRKRGIYVTTDIYVSRKLKAGDNIPEWIPNGNGYQMKALLPISRAAMENWKEFARRWLGHRNPYTGMTWAEDPALYIVSFTNENNLYAKLAEEPGIAEQYRNLYPKWMKQHYPGEDPGRPLMNNRRFQEFLYTLQHESILEQAKFLKEELGLKALRTDVNMHNRIPLALIRDDLDTVDDHKYQDHPSFPINRWKLPGLYRQRSSISDLGNEVPEQLFAARLFGKPFSITEYKFCVPNQFRSEGGPLIGGYAALQGWDALYQFAWSHSDWAVKQDIPLGNFDFANEPLSWLSDRLVMLLFRRGDVSPSKERFAWNVPKNFWNSDMPLEYPLDFSRLGLIAGIGTVVDNRQVPGVQVISANAAAGKAPLPDRKIQALRQTLLRTGVAESSTGELRLDSRKNTLAIQTPRTLSATLASGNLTAGALTVRQVTYPTTVSVSSLDDAPVARSGKLLLFHLTNVIDSGTTFKGEKMQYLLKWGKLPHLVRRAPAKVSLRLDGDTVPKVEALHFDGTVRGEVKSTFANGVLSFTADPGCFPGGVMVYWITRDTKPGV